MYYDLNVPCPPGGSSEVNRTVSFLAELGYDTIALSHTLTGTFPGQIINPLPKTLSTAPPNVRILRRCTLILEDLSQNHRLAALTSAYDILALRPTTEKLLQQACGTLECDLISLDFSQRLPYYLKHKVVGKAIQRGLCFEIGYAAAITDVAARRNLIGNATMLIRATRGGRGIVISSEAKKALACRAPHDIMNMATIWGLSSEGAREAVTGLARSVVIQAQMRRRSFKGVVDVIDDGVTEEERLERKRKAEEQAAKGGNSKKQKQSQSQVQTQTGSSAASGHKLSKKERKAAAKAARTN